MLTPVNPAQPISSAGGGSRRGVQPPSCHLVVFFKLNHRTKDSPMGIASLAPAVAANPQMAIETVSRGDEPDSHMNAVTPAQLISSAGGGSRRGVQPPSCQILIFTWSKSPLPTRYRLQGGATPLRTFSHQCQMIGNAQNTGIKTFK